MSNAFAITFTATTAPATLPTGVMNGAVEGLYVLSANFYATRLNTVERADATVQDRLAPAGFDGVEVYAVINVDNGSTAEYRSVQAEDTAEDTPEHSVEYLDTHSSRGHCHTYAVTDAKGTTAHVRVRFPDSGRRWDVYNGNGNLVRAAKWDAFAQAALAVDSAR